MMLWHGNDWGNVNAVFTQGPSFKVRKQGVGFLGEHFGVRLEEDWLWVVENKI